MHSAAAGERLLTAIQNHQNNFALSSNTDAGTGVTGSIVVTGCTGGYILAITNKPLRTGSSLPYGRVTVFVNIIACVCWIIDNSTSIGQDSKERIGFTGSTEIYTINNSIARRLTSLHIVERGVYTGNYAVVITDVVGIFGIRVLLVRICNLFRQFRHTQLLIFVLLQIRGLYDYIVTGNISRCNVVDHLLTIRSIGILDVLSHAGSQRGYGIAEYRVGITFFVTQLNSFQ